MGAIYKDFANARTADNRAVAAQLAAAAAQAAADAAQTDATQALADAAAALAAAQAASAAALAAGTKQIYFWVPTSATPFMGASGESAALIQAGTGNIERPAAGSGMCTGRNGATYSTAAGAGSIASIRNGGVGSVMRGSAAGEGGFVCYWRFGTPITNATTRCFFGLTINPTTWGNIDPSSRTDIVGIGFEANNGDANLQLFHNDNAGTATKVDLGANFVISNTAVYECTFTVAPNSSSIAYKVVNLETGNEATGTLSTNLPTNTTNLSSFATMNNGTTATAVRMKTFRHSVDHYS